MKRCPYDINPSSSGGNNADTTVVCICEEGIMSVTKRIGTKPSWVATILVGLLVAASVACAGFVAPPDSLDTDRFDLPGVVVQYES